MDNVPDSEMQRSTSGPRSPTVPVCSALCTAFLKMDLSERLRVCAALDKRFFKSWFDELDMERCGNFSSFVGASNDYCMDTEWRGNISCQDRSFQQASEAACQMVSLEMQDIQERERKLDKHVQKLNLQYQNLMAELAEPVRNSDCQLIAKRQKTRLEHIAMIVSAKEIEQKRHLYHLRHWNLERTAVNIPRLPRLLPEMPTVTDV